MSRARSPRSTPSPAPRLPSLHRLWRRDPPWLSWELCLRKVESEGEIDVLDDPHRGWPRSWPARGCATGAFRLLGWGWRTRKAPKISFIAAFGRCSGASSTSAGGLPHFRCRPDRWRDVRLGPSVSLATASKGLVAPPGAPAVGHEIGGAPSARLLVALALGGADRRRARRRSARVADLVNDSSLTSVALPPSLRSSAMAPSTLRAWRRCPVRSAPSSARIAR